MIQIEFDIIGNHADPGGNPMPKLKMTGNQSWTARAQIYVQWKNHVRKALLDTLRTHHPEAARIAEQNIARCGKPLILNDRTATLDIKIAWGSGNHGDPENIFGSIADALFFNDKNLWGSFSPLESERGGLVRCILNVSEPARDKKSAPLELQAISEQRTWKHSSSRKASPRSKAPARKH